jgi:phenylacetate-coenzyme A ligase PaaK-like adenylate-forming protein
MKIDSFKYKTKFLQKTAKFLGVRVHVYRQYSKEKTIDIDGIESPNDYKQVTSVPERQIND